VNKKKYFSIIAILVLFSLMIIAFFIYRWIYNKQDIVVYSTNVQGCFRNIEEIYDEKFDNFGNLIHYKYKPQTNNNTSEEYEFNIDYKFDSNNKITKVSDNYANYIEIQYDDSDRIAKLTNETAFPLKTSYEYDFSYIDNTTIIKFKNIFASNLDPLKELTYKSIPTKIEGKNYISVNASNVANETVYEILYEKINKEINHSNIFSLLDIVFYGYCTFDTSIKPTNFEIPIPIFNTGKLTYMNTFNTSSNYYYDSSNKILKFESSSNTVNYMYKDISSTEYYCYSLGNQNGNYTFDKYKDYIKNGKLYKRELIKSTKISLEEYEKEFEKFNKYFEKNKM